MRRSAGCLSLLALCLSSLLAPGSTSRFGTKTSFEAGLAWRSISLPPPAMELDRPLVSASRRWPGIVRDSRFGSDLFWPTSLPPRLSSCLEAVFADSRSLLPPCDWSPFRVSRDAISLFSDVRFCRRSGGPPFFSERSDCLPTNGERLAFSREACDWPC